MLNRKWAVGLLAVTGLLAGAALAQAGDTFRLALPTRDDAPAMKLGQIDPQADLMDVAWRGWGGGYRGWGGHGGYRSWGGYGGYRGWGGYSGYRGWGGYGGWYGGYRGWGGYSGYRPAYHYHYYYPRYRGYVYSNHWPISSPAPVVTSTFSLGITPVGPRVLTTPMPFADEAPALPPGGTFEYDGGPRAPIPMPQPEKMQPIPMSPPQTVPLEGRPVSLPARATPKYTYTAYGELPRLPADGRDRTLPVKADSTQRVKR